jgi:hypothetical protein
MKALSSQFVQRTTLTSFLLDIGALSFIYMVPTISHLISLPVYLIEPMRLMLIFALVHTNKTNALILAVTMPVFSFLISSHPEFPKMILMSLELSLNVLLFYTFLKQTKLLFPSILISIVLSKILYYLLKFSFIKLAFLNTELISTPIIIQVVTSLIFSSYLYFFYRKRTFKS